MSTVHVTSIYNNNNIIIILKLVKLELFVEARMTCLRISIMQIAGYVTTYDRNDFTFITVKGSGHMVNIDYCDIIHH